MQTNSIIYLMYGPKRDEATDVGWSLHDEMVHNLHCSNYFDDEE